MSAEPGISLQEYAGVLWRRRWYVLAVFIPVVIGGIVFTYLATPIYRSQVILEVNAAVIRPAEIDPFAGLFLSRAAVASFVESARTPSIRETVNSQLDLSTKGQGLGEISVSQIGQTEYFSISVEHPDRGLARDIGNAMAEVLKRASEKEWADRVEIVELSLQSRVQSVLISLEKTRDAIAATTEEDVPEILQLELIEYQRQYSDLLRSLEETRLIKDRTTSVLTVQSLASLPSSPISPRPLLNISLVLVLGTMAGLMLAFGIEYVDNRVHGPDRLGRMVGLPVLGALPVIPQEPGGAMGETLQSSGKGSTNLEPFYLLRTNLRLADGEKKDRVTLITSAEIGEGKTTVLSYLGVAMAELGQRVILVDADLRRPQLHKRFDLPLSGGLLEWLTEETEDLQTCLKETGLPGLQVVTGVSRHAHPARLIGSIRMAQLISAWQEEGAYVLLDSPPVLYGSEALLLAEMADQVLLVMRAGKLKWEALQRAKEALERVDAKKVDVVLNMVRRDRDPYAYYSYYYQSHHAHSKESADA